MLVRGLVEVVVKVCMWKLGFFVLLVMNFVKFVVSFVQTLVYCYFWRVVERLEGPPAIIERSF